MRPKQNLIFGFLFLTFIIAEAQQPEIVDSTFTKTYIGNNSFLPLKKGNYWQYKNNADNNRNMLFGLSQFFVKDSLFIGEKKYYKTNMLLIGCPILNHRKLKKGKDSFENYFKPATYINFEGDQYNATANYLYSFKGKSPFLSKSIKIQFNINISEFTFLRTDLPEKGRWSSEVQVNVGISAASSDIDTKIIDTTYQTEVNCQILRKRISVMIQGELYHNVTVVKSFSEFGKMIIWYAKGVGIIYQRGNIMMGHVKNFFFEQRLMSYDIQEVRDHD